MKLTLTKSDGFDRVSEGINRLEVAVIGPLQLTYGDLRVTVDQHIPVLGGGLYREGDSIAEYDGYEQEWTLAGGTHWSDIVIEPDAHDA